MADNNRPFCGSAGMVNLCMIRMLLLLILVGTCLDHARTLAQATVPAQSTTNSEAGIDRDVQLLRQDIRSQVKQLIAANLKLTDTEATKFWPVYDQYTADLVKINDQRYAVIKEYSDEWGTVNDDQALSLARRYLALDEQVAQLRTKYLPIFNQAVPGTTVATFFQLDHRIQEMIDLQLASQLPLVQEQ
jgi:hypothetical protein